MSKKWESMFKRECERALKTLSGGGGVGGGGERRGRGKGGGGRGEAMTAEEALRPLLFPAGTGGKEGKEEEKNGREGREEGKDGGKDGGMRGENKKEEEPIDLEGEDEAKKEWQQQQLQQETRKTGGTDEEHGGKEEGKEGKDMEVTSSSSSSSSTTTSVMAPHPPPPSSSSSSSFKDKDLLDPFINARLICPHGGLLPPPSTKKHYRLLPASAWTFFHRLFPRALPLLHGTPPCPTCVDAKISLTEINLVKRKERDECLNCKELRELARRSTAFPPSLRREIEDWPLGRGERGGGEERAREYVFVDRAWLEGWRDYVSDYLVKKKPPAPTNEKGLRYGGRKEGREGGRERRKHDSGVCVYVSVCVCVCLCVCVCSFLVSR